MKTFVPKIDPQNRKWYVVDLQDVILGRAAVKVANILRGKNKPIFTPHLDTGDHVVVINAKQMRVTGKNTHLNLRYYRYSGYPGGLKEITLRNLLQKHPTRAIEYAVRGMLPKNRLGRRMIKKLKVYAGPDHPHEAQQPKPFELT